MTRKKPVYDPNDPAGAIRAGRVRAARRKRRNPTPPKAERLAWVPAFLETLKDTGNVRASAQAADVNRSTAYKTRNADPDFSRAWDVAMEDAIDVLEYVARQRAVREKNPSDLLLIFLLKAHRPEKFSDRVKVDVTIDDLRREAEAVARDTGLDFEEVWEETQRIYAKERRQG